jgi:hypothetical protein
MSKRRDVLIRNVGESFVVADAKGARTLAGPFPLLADALRAAREQARGGTIWRENLDLRGRPMGPRGRMDTEF